MSRALVIYFMQFSNFLIQMYNPRILNSFSVSDRRDPWT